MNDFGKTDQARLALLRALDARGYAFVTPTPTTHHRVLASRGPTDAHDLNDVFGWSHPFQPGLLEPELLAHLRYGGLLEDVEGRLRSLVRVARLGDGLFLHSAFPPQKDAVFFGPDTYRFADFIRSELPVLRAGARVLDIGTGSGAGGIFTAGLAPGVRLTLTDCNPTALAYARVNAAFSNLEPDLRQGEGLAGAEGPLDLVLANPPYVAGASGQTYADGGGDLGGELSLIWAREAMGRLSPGGRMLLYTGSAILRGRDPLRDALDAACAEAGFQMTYRELDADVFPVLLAHPAYRGVERIAAVGAVIHQPG